LLLEPDLSKTTNEAIITAYPPLSTTHHGVNFVKTTLQELGRPGMVRYVDAICSTEGG
jgi:hypothetical protein